jgi:hypothetical protein
MKSSLNRTFLWGAVLILLQNEGVFSQPIQLVPQNGEETHEQPQVNDLLTSSRELLSSSQDLSEFWEGTPPSVIETYLPKLPLRLTSPLMRNLRTQIVKEPYTELLQNKVYAKALLLILTAGGEWEQAKELLMETDLPEKESLLLDLQWLGGDTKKACEKIANLIRTSPHTEWKKQNIYCLYLNGEEQRAKILAEVLSESDPSGSQLLNTLFDPSARPPFDQAIANSPFLLTVWLESKQSIPEDELDKLSSASLALIARSEKPPLPSRLLASEKAMQQGTLKPEDLLALFKEMPETEFWGQVTHVLKAPKAENLLPLLERAEQEQKLGILGQAFHTSLSFIEPSSETLSLAPFMIRAFIQGEEKALAKKWGTFFMREAPDEAISILPLLYFAFPENKWDKPQIQAWQAYENRVHPKMATQRSYEMRRILDALAEPSGDPMMGELSAPSWRQEKGLFDGEGGTLLASAAASKRKGEVLLLTLALMGETPLLDFPVDKLVPILKALDKAGYRQEARLLALEFLLAKGF